MTTRNTKRTKFVQSLTPRLPLLGVIAVFGVLGVVLLSASKADTPADSAVTNVTLAPNDSTIAEGDMINIAINVDTKDQVAQEDKATVTFPAATLELQSIQNNCDDPAFQGVTKSSQLRGELTIGCKGRPGVTGKHTVATLVFKALAASNNAAIDVNDATSITRFSDGKPIVSSKTGSKVHVESLVKPAANTPRAIPNYTSRRSCTNTQPGHVNCLVRKALDSTGKPLASPQAAATAYSPKEFHKAYQMPCTPGGPVAAVCATPSTYGPQTIAIVDAGDYTGGPAALEADLQAYNQKFGIAACNRASGCLTVVNQTGGATLPAVLPGWPDETILDVEAVHMMCQTCKIALIESNDDSAKQMDAANNYAASLRPIAISDSWSGGTGTQAYYNHPGTAQVIADGDDGTLTADNAPDDYPEVVSVSGSNLTVTADGSWSSETLWSKSGGGCSPTGNAASWQTSLSNWATAGCGSKRAYGDITADGDPATGMLVVQGNYLYQVGGTSLAAPLVAGMFGLSGGLPPTTVAPSILYANNTSANFHDITSGNDCITTNTAHCTTGPGFDVPSGLGSPTGLGAFKTSASTPGPTPSPTPPPTPPTPGGKIGDLNGDGKVTIIDLSILLSAWGKGGSAADLNNSGKVDIIDLSILLSHFGS